MDRERLLRLERFGARFSQLEAVREGINRMSTGVHSIHPKVFVLRTWPHHEHFAMVELIVEEGFWSIVNSCSE